MWNCIYIQDTINKLLPSMSQIIMLDKPYRRPAIMLADLDGDGVPELICAYYYQGEKYIIVLKHSYDGWYAADTAKGKGYNITYFGAVPVTNGKGRNLIVGWQVGSIWSDLSVYEWTDKGLRDLITGNKYYSMMEAEDMEGTKWKDGIYELALWIHDTGDAYRVEIYRWENNKFILAQDVYPYYFKKVANYYKKLLREKDSTTYWYYLADAQIKTGNLEEALNSIDKALAAKYPYPSREELIRLKKQILQERSYSNQQVIDFSSIKYIESETEKDIKLEEALVEAFNLDQSEGKVRYYYNKVDLNEDGIPEVFVFLTGPFVCGTGGCSGAVFKQEDDEYKLLSSFSLVRNPVIISNTKTNGYRDIIMYVSGGGVESFYAWVKYNGSVYPGNPSVQPMVELGTKVNGIAVIADDISKNSGIEIS
ncbi:MAG: tetratricopeptide repeat protein [Bacillota bacterium]|nr:tetratricopeptide repeat protein [Bacillota bacterium]